MRKPPNRFRKIKNKYIKYFKYMAKQEILLTEIAKYIAVISQKFTRFGDISCSAREGERRFAYVDVSQN